MTDLHNPAALSIDADEQQGADADAIQVFRWTLWTVSQSIFLFFLAAVFEVGGGWLIWETIREGRPWWWALLGSVALIVYGFIPTLQPVAHFGRVFAVYGGFFILYSYGWGWLLDGQRPDTGDFAGAGIAIFGVVCCWFWPRKQRVD